MGGHKELFTQWQTEIADAGELLLPHGEQIEAFVLWGEREGLFPCPESTPKLNEEELCRAYEQGYEAGAYDLSLKDTTLVGGRGTE